MRKRHREDMKDFRLSLTSLLDLVFNILAFFVITYKPPLQTKDYQVNLPPPKQVESHASSETMFAPRNPEQFKDISIGLEAGEGGVLSGITLEGKAIPLGEKARETLASSIKKLCDDVINQGGEPITAVNIVAAPELKYRYLLTAVDACRAAGIEKVGFMPMR